MAKYEFEYVNQKYSLALFFISFATFFALIFTLVEFKKFFNIYATMILSFGIPILIFWLNKHKIKKSGFAVLEDNYTEISKLDKVERINFDEIKNYQVQDYNGNISLLINLKDGKKMNLSSSSTFCNAEYFGNYCQELEHKIEKYRSLHQLETIRKKTFFEKPWIYPFLLIITGIVIVFVIILISKGGKFPTSLIGAVAPLLTLWGGYFSAKNKAKKQQGENL
jgi:hypothetical protein